MEAESSDSGNAAAAFEALRAEVSELRAAVQALPAQWEEHQAPDTTETLAKMLQGLTVVDHRLGLIEQHPALRSTPAEHRAAIEAAGERAMRGAIDQLQRAGVVVDRAGERLDSVIGTVREQEHQWLTLAWSGGVLFCIGLLVSPFLAGLLPFGLDTRVAASVLATDRWHAGEALMQAADAEAWRGVVSDMKLMASNQALLAPCREAAAKAKKEQRCTVVVAPE